MVDLDLDTLDTEQLNLEHLREDIRTKRAHTALLKAQERKEIAAAKCTEHNTRL